MVTTKVQEVVRGVLKQTQELHSELGRVIKPDDKGHAFETFLRSRLDNFKYYASISQRMTAEITLNLSKDLRPAQELTYLENLESFITSISSTYKDVETQDWEDTIRLRLQNPLGAVNGILVKIVISSIEKELVSELIEQVRVCCYNFDLECEEIAKKANESFFVQKYPHNFPNIVSYLPPLQPTNQVVLVDEVEPSFKDVDEKLRINHNQNGGVDDNSTSSGVRLKLKCSPAIAGYIVSELIRGDYIEIPIRHGTINYTELGRICSQIFELPNQFKTSADGWRKVIDVDSIGGNQLIDSKRAKLRLPDRKDLE